MKRNILKNKFFSKKITRKEAIKKAGVTALTTATLFFLETKPAAAQSQETGLKPENPGGSGGTGRPDR